MSSFFSSWVFERSPSSLRPEGMVKSGLTHSGCRYWDTVGGGSNTHILNAPRAGDVHCGSVVRSCDSMPSAVRWFVWTALQCACHFTMSTGTPAEGLSGTRGSYETPAAMVAVPSRGGTNTTLSVPGFGLAPAHSALPMTEVRESNMFKLFERSIALNSVLSSYGLTRLISDGYPPSRKAVLGRWPNATSDEIDGRFADAMREYQAENKLLFNSSSRRSNYVSRGS